MDEPPRHSQRRLLEEVSCLLLATLHLLADRCGGGATEEGTEHPWSTAGSAASNSIFPFPREAIASFRPSFSYAASLSADLNEALTNLDRLHRHVEERSGRKVFSACGGNNRRQMELQEATLSIAVPIEELSDAGRRILGEEALVVDEDDVDGTSPSSPYWTDRRLFVEHECNLRAGPACGAARALLSDVAVASGDYLNRIERVFEEDDSGHNDGSGGGGGGTGTRGKRAGRSLERLRSVGGIVLHFYSFSVYVALRFIEEVTASGCRDRNYGTEVHGGTTAETAVADRLLPLRAVERTRMCLSTFASFVAINLDRALKSLETYLAGKVVKELIVKRIEDTGRGVTKKR